MLGEGVIIKILLIDGEIQLCKSLKEFLRNENYIVDYVHEGLSGINNILRNHYDIILLDIMLPDMNGIEVMTYIRGKYISTPIMILTAKNKITDKINGFDNGADDYLTKPFNPEELLARLRALYRRNSDMLKEDNITFDNIILNKSRIALCSQNKTEYLTRIELELANLFIRNPYHVLRKDMIISKVWPFDDDVSYNTLEVHISSLRKKMKNIASKPKIVTVRGIGYKLEA